MDLPDVNVLVYAFKPQQPEQHAYQQWLETLINGSSSFAISETVLAGFLRIVTHPQIFRNPSNIADALQFAESLLARRNCVRVRPGPRHWDIFCDLCRRSGAKGNVVSDAYLAAMAIEHGCEFVTTDRHFARFPGLQWRHPLQ